MGRSARELVGIVLGMGACAALGWALVGVVLGEAVLARVITGIACAVGSAGLLARTARHEDTLPPVVDREDREHALMSALVDRRR